MQPAVYRPGTTQKVTVSDTSAAVSNAFGSGIHKLRIVSDTDCHFVLGASPTATTSDPYLPADTVEYITVSQGEKIAFLQDSAGGNAYATEVTP